MRAISRSVTLSVVVVAALCGAAWEATQARPLLRAIATEGEAIAMADAVMGRRLEGQAVQVKFKDLEAFLKEDDDEDEDCDEYVLAGGDEDEDEDEDCDEYEIADEESEETVSMKDLKSLLGKVKAAGDEKPKKGKGKSDEEEEEEEDDEEDEEEE